MNGIREEYQQDRSRVIDRLVDGELSQADEQAVLQLLEQDGGAWRACALAFLESRVWLREFNSWKTLPEPATVAAVNTPAVSPVTKSSWWHSPSVAWASAAAAVLVVLTLRGLMIDAPQRNGEREIVNVPVQPPPMPGTMVAEQQRGTNQNTLPTSPWKTFAVGFNGGQEQMELPAMEVGQVDPQWLERTAPNASAVVRALKQAGNNVRQVRELWPIPLQDGRKLIVPVDQLEVQYVGDQRFQ